MLDDWRCDQYRWVNNAVRKLPRQNPTIKKTYFLANTFIGPLKEFTKQAYELVPSNGNVLIHYLGNEKAACDFAHKNAKHTDKGYVRTCPSTIRSLENDCSQWTTSKVYKKNITSKVPTSYVPVYQARNSQQIENLRNKQLVERRITHDSLYNLHEIAIDLPEFVHKIETHPNMVCVCGLKSILDELEKLLPIQSPSPQIMSYDTTFQLGDFYISVFAFRHTLFKESPVIPAAFLVHERKFQECHKELLNELLKHAPSLNQSKYPIVTDEEKGIVNAVVAKLPTVTRLRCWNHITRDVKRWLRSHAAPSQDVLEYTKYVQQIFHQRTLVEYQTQLDEMQKKWSAPFYEYFLENIHAQITSIGR